MSSQQTHDEAAADVCERVGTTVAEAFGRAVVFADIRTVRATLIQQAWLDTPRPMVSRMARAFVTDEKGVRKAINAPALPFPPVMERVSADGASSHLSARVAAEAFAVLGVDPSVFHRNPGQRTPPREYALVAARRRVVRYMRDWRGLGGLQLSFPEIGAAVGLPHNTVIGLYRVRGREGAAA